MLTRYAVAVLVLFPQLLWARTTKDVRITFDRCAIDQDTSFTLKIGNVDGKASWELGNTWHATMATFVAVDDKRLELEDGIPGVSECCRELKERKTGQNTSSIEWIIRCDSIPQWGARVDTDSPREFSFVRVHPTRFKSEQCVVEEGYVRTGGRVEGFLQQDRLKLMLKQDGKPVAEFELTAEEVKKGRPFTPAEIEDAAKNYQRKSPKSPVRVAGPAAGVALLKNEDLPRSIIVRTP